VCLFGYKCLVSDTFHGNAPTLQELFAHCNQSSIARAIGRSRAFVNAIARGRAVPDVSDLPKLSEIFRVDLDKLALIVADQAKRMEAQRARGVA
jgi:transcriptional regulator with XRE-family HTH domain